VTFKDAFFRASTPLRHVVELLAMNTTIKRKLDTFVLAFTDGGLDHNISFPNVMIYWLGYFILGQCDFLVVARTSPTQSWSNPAELLMFVINLALSNCALSRERMSDGFEKNMKKCGNMSGVRKLAEALAAAAKASSYAVPSSIIVPPLASIVADETTTSIGDVASMGAEDVVEFDGDGGHLNAEASLIDLEVPFLWHRLLLLFHRLLLLI